MIIHNLTIDEDGIKRKISSLEALKVLLRRSYLCFWLAYAKANLVSVSVQVISQRLLAQ